MAWTLSSTLRSLHLQDRATGFRACSTPHLTVAHTLLSQRTGLFLRCRSQATSASAASFESLMEVCGVLSGLSGLDRGSPELVPAGPAEPGGCSSTRQRAAAVSAGSSEHSCTQLSSGGCDADPDPVPQAQAAALQDAHSSGAQRLAEVQQVSQLQAGQELEQMLTREGAQALERVLEELATASAQSSLIAELQQSLAAHDAALEEVRAMVSEPAEAAPSGSDQAAAAR